MKKRLLSLALSATMLFGSINFAVAEEAPVQDSQETVVETSEADEASEVSDDTASGSAVDTVDLQADETMTHYPVSTAGN